MGVVQPGVDVDGGQFFKAVADDLRPAFIEGGFPGLNVPLPRTDVSSVDKSKLYSADA